MVQLYLHAQKQWEDYEGTSLLKKAVGLQSVNDETSDLSSISSLSRNSISPDKEQREVILYLNFRRTLLDWEVEELNSWNLTVGLNCFTRKILFELMVMWGGQKYDHHYVLFPTIYVFLLLSYEFLKHKTSFLFSLFH